MKEGPGKEKLVVLRARWELERLLLHTNATENQLFCEEVILYTTWNLNGDDLTLTSNKTAFGVELAPTLS